MKIVLLLVMSGILFACSGENRSQKNNNPSKVGYSEFYEMNYVGMKPDKVRSLLGEPDRINDEGVALMWHYGPDMNVMLEGKKGDIVGMDVYFEDEAVSTVMPARITR